MEDVQKARLKAVLAVIEATPERHNQEYWACGTARCFGGWAVELFGPPGVEFLFTPGRSISGRLRAPVEPGSAYVYVMRKSEFSSDRYLFATLVARDEVREGEEAFSLKDVPDVAREVLGINEDDSDGLFWAFNDISDLRRMVAEILDGEPATHSENCDCETCTAASQEDDYCDCGECNDD